VSALPSAYSPPKKKIQHTFYQQTEMVPCWQPGMNPCSQQDAWKINQHISCHLESNGDDEYFTANSDDGWDDFDLEE
jgi:hypothetical protein